MIQNDKYNLKKGRIAFCTVPHYGGIYSVYLRLRKALIPHGWEVFAVEVGNERCNWEYQKELADEGCVKIASGETNLKRGAQAFVDWVEKENIDIVIPFSDIFCLSAVPHLPAKTQVVTRCVDMTPIAYREATTVRKHTSMIVVTSLRQYQDLQKYYWIPQKKLRLIPNAVDVNRFVPSLNPNRQESMPLRLVFVDRLYELQKNVFALPKIMKLLDMRGISVTLDIIGGGTEMEELREKLQPWIKLGKVRLLGPQPVGLMPKLLINFDILIKTTRTEGFPSSLIEAMASGVVPICSHIRKVTDFIIEDQKTGILCPIDNINAFVDAIAELANNREKLTNMSENARHDVVQRFGIEQFGEKWAKLFSDVVQLSQSNTRPKSWSTFKPNAVIKPPLMNRLFFRFLPRRFKQQVRTKIEVLRGRFT